MRKLAALGAVALALSGCATGLNTNVTRYSAAAIVPGQTFFVQPARAVQPDLQFNRYATMVAQQLESKGLRPAASPQAADMLVKLDYGVDEGQTEYVQDYVPSYRRYGYGYGWGPYGFGYRDPFFDARWGVYYGRPHYSRWGRDPFYYGWDDPFWYASPYAGYGRYGYGGIREYTVYKGFLDMDIVRKGDNLQLFQGHAKARSQTDNEDVVVPNLITAMFTGFPGKNGETVKITVPARKR